MFLSLDPWQVGASADTVPPVAETRRRKRRARTGSDWTILSGRGPSSLESEDSPCEPVGEPSALADAERDGRLVDGARAGVRGDLEALLARLSIVPRILCVLNQRLGSPLRNDELEDVAQDTATRIWMKLDTFNATSTLETWFFGIARFELMNAARRLQRRRSEEVGEVTAPEDPLRHVDIERVRLALTRIDRDEARVVYLHHFEDLTLEQAARRLGIAASTAKGRYYRGIERLHAHLKGRLDREPR